jgi:hypothetical protein
MGGGTARRGRRPRRPACRSVRHPRQWPLDAADREQRGARLVSSADLPCAARYDRPLLFGRAEVERGEVLFEGQPLRGHPYGTVDFSNPTRIEPFFDVEAETRVRVPGQTYRVGCSA